MALGRSGVWSLAIVAALAPAVAGAAPTAAQSALPAFPGAEGFGAVASGGRGGRVMIVTTLNPTGPGSLGEAMSPKKCEPRIVVFRVSGIINSEFDLTCGNVTIAGQTAPGGGVTIRGRIDGYDAKPGGNIIMRHLRVRPPRPVQGKGHFHDAIQLSNNRRVILDHISASWASDEVVDFFEGTSDVTIQWSTIEASRTDGHPEGRHNYGVIIGPEVPRVSFHHNVCAHHRARCPAMAKGPAEAVNNVVYDTQDGFVHHNPADGEFHVVGNTYRRGPSSHLVPFYFDDEDPGGTRYWVRDNRIDDPGEFEGTVDDIWKSPPHEGLEEAGGERYAITDPEDFSKLGAGYVPIRVEPAAAAYESVLARAGSFPRDGVTSRTIEEVRARTGRWGAGEPDDLFAGLTAAAPPPDADNDGMADAWETSHGLNPQEGGDHARVRPSGYTAIEEYINELADGLTSSGVAAPPSAPAAAGASDAGASADEASSDGADAESSADGESGGWRGPLTIALALIAAAIVGLLVGVRYGRRTAPTRSRIVGSHGDGPDADGRSEHRGRRLTRGRVGGRERRHPHP